MANRSGVKAGAAFIELYVNDSRFVKGLSAAGAKLKAFGASVTAVGTRLGMMGAAVTAPFIYTAKVFADMGSALVDMSQQTGASVEALSELGYAAEMSGSNAETLGASLNKMQKYLVSARDGSQGAVDTFSELGLSLADLQAVAPDQQFAMIADAIAAIEGPANRAAAAMKIFGRSGANLLPLMAGGAAGIEELRQRARDLGITMSTEDAQAAEAFGDLLETLWKVTKRLTAAVGAALTPTLTKLANKILSLSKRTIDWLDANRETVATIFKVAAGVTLVGGALVAAGVSITMMGVALGGLASIITGVAAALGTIVTVLGALLTPIGLVLAGVGALGAAFLTMGDNGGKVVEWLGSQFVWMGEVAKATFEAVTTALASGQFAAAANVAWAGMRLAWVRGTADLRSQWQDFSGDVALAWIETTNGLAVVMTDVSANLQQIWASLSNILRNTWGSMLAVFKTQWIGWTTSVANGLAHIRGFAKHVLGELNNDPEAKSAAVAEEAATVAANNAERDRGQREAFEQNEADKQERDRATQAAKEAIAAEQAGIKDALAAMLREGKGRLNKKNEDAIANAAAKLEEATKAWKESIKDTKGITVPASSVLGQSYPYGEMPSSDYLAVDAERKFSSSSTFNGRLAEQIFGGQSSVEDKQLRVQMEIRDEIKRGNNKDQGIPVGAA